MSFEMNDRLQVLVACEFSGIVRDAFQRLGHDAWSCDLEPTESPGQHILGDVLDVLDDPRWDLLIAHPPCDYLANCGVRWRVERQEWAEIEQGARFFKRFMDCDIPFKAIENPVMHKYGVEIVGCRQDFTCQPWQFGDLFRKRICWWTLGTLPALIPTSRITTAEALEIARPAAWLEAPGPERKKNRSRFFPLTAAVLADQWSKYILGLKEAEELF